MRTATYVRVSTMGQDVENQLTALRAAAESRGWQIVAAYQDVGISGAKGREGRPGYEALCQAIEGRTIDMLMAWSIDRIGRSAQDLLTFSQLAQKHGVELFFQQQQIDTSTPAGRAMFGMVGIFAEFERDIIRERVRAGLVRAKAEGKRFGAPRIDRAIEDRARQMLVEGVRFRAICREAGIGRSTLSRIRRDMEAECA